MPPSSPAHPSPRQLEAYALGRLPAEQAAAIEAHVAQCEACGRALGRASDDTMLDLARAAKASAVPPELRDHPRYRIVGTIGAGGMGSVFAAEHRIMERPVAIKIVHPDLVADPRAVERFRREVKAAARLNHPNIVQAYDAEQAGAIHFLAMERVDGTDLQAYVAQRGPLPIAEACDCVVQAARGLAHAHSLGMIHRDIKPRNLMIAPDGRVKILDFGLARFARQTLDARRGDASTAPDAIVGTPDFLAPEQARDAKSTDIRADLYGLGGTLFFLLTGRPPFDRGSALEKIVQHCTAPPPRVEELRRDVPPRLSAIVARLLAKNPDDRFQTPEELIAALEPFASKSPVAAPRRTVVGAIAAAVVAAVLIVGVAAWTLSPREEASPAKLATATPRALFVLPQANLHLPDFAPVKRELEAGGVKVEIASSGPKPCQLDKYSQGEPVVPNRVLDGRPSMDDYDLVVFVGAGADEFIGADAAGRNAGRLLADATTRPGKLAAAICVGQAIPLKHGLLDGRRVADSKYLAVWLKERGEPTPPKGPIAVRQPVVVDGSLVTAGDPEHAAQLGRELVRILKERTNR